MGIFERIKAKAFKTIQIKLIVNMKACILLYLCLIFSHVNSQITYPATLDIRSSNGKLFINTEEIKIKGMNYFGFETDIHTVHGLWSQSLETILDFLVLNNFNALRIPFSLDMIQNLDTKP
jgi:aryl-phospho-beta-D-glucosidase BglC (GH1 family)